MARTSVGHSFLPVGGLSSGQRKPPQRLRLRAKEATISFTGSVFSTPDVPKISAEAVCCPKATRILAWVLLPSLKSNRRKTPAKELFSSSRTTTTSPGGVLFESLDDENVCRVGGGEPRGVEFVVTGGVRQPRPGPLGV